MRSDLHLDELDEILQIFYFYNVSLQRVLNNNIIIIYPYSVYGFTILKYLLPIFYGKHQTPFEDI